MMMHYLNKALIFILVIVLIGPALVFADPPLPTPVGRVVWVKGTFKAIMPNKEQRILQKMSVIYLHDTLVTDATSQAQIAFTDDSLMTFRGGSNFTVSEYSFSKKKKASTGRFFGNLIEGGFRTITGLIAKNNSADYKVHTPVATIGVRGTDYTVYVHKGQLYVGFYKGSPCVSNKGQTLCLDNKTPYAFVPSDNAAPVPESQQPDVFKEKLNILEYQIQPFGGTGGGGTQGPISSFCISS